MKRQNPNFCMFFPNHITVFPPFANHMPCIFPPFHLYFLNHLGWAWCLYLKYLFIYLKYLPKIFRQSLLNLYSEFLILLYPARGWNLFPAVMFFRKGNQKCYFTPSSLQKILDLPEGLGLMVDLTVLG